MEVQRLGREVDKLLVSSSEAMNEWSCTSTPYAFMVCAGIIYTTDCWSCDTGDLERLRRYWMTGTCKPGKQEHKSSDPLALEQFLSAFLLLMSGILLAAVLLALEHVYFKYVRKRLAKRDRGGCCALISLVSIAAGWPLPKEAVPDFNKIS